MGVVVWFLSAAIVAGVFQNSFLFFALGGVLLARALVARTWSAWGWIVAAALCALIGAGSGAGIGADGAHVARVAASHGGALVPLDGHVVSFPTSSPFGTSFLYETVVEGRRVRLAMRAAFFDVNYGDAFSCRARVIALADDNRLVAREAAGTARVRLRDTSARVARAHGSWHRSVFWQMHRVARTRLSRAMSRDADLPLGLMLGERGFLERGLREAVIRLGIAHLLALSGMHLGVVAMIAILAARALPRGRDLLVLLALTGYIGMVGDVDSLSRAYLMAVILVLARAWVRPLRPLDALGKALLLMLLVAPVAIRSVGLQLSFAATWAVIVAVERMPFLRRGRLPGPWGAKRMARAAATAVAGALLISVAVEIVIAPLQFHYFGKISCVGPVATALFVLPVTVVQVLAIITAALAEVPGLGDAAVACLTVASRATVAAVHAAAAVAPNPIEWGGPYVPLYYAAILVAWRFPRRPAAWVACALLLAGALWAG